MDSYSSGGEKLNIKTRKPYTITKQRERWTEDEHNSFLEALKLYGRAWQRIEEHIGTKTAVQIRSHAQKFFTKLEKEALAKGIPTKQALDIEIPPPRPKRKPNYPYPRKTDPQDGKQQATLVSSLQLLDLETKLLPETSSHQEKLDETSDQGEVLLQENENQGVCMPSLEETNNHNESYITTTETRKYQDDTSNTSSLFDNPSQQPGVHNNYPRNVPVQVEDSKNSVPTFHESSSSSLNKSGVVDKNPLISSSSSSSCYHQIVANIHPLLNPFCCDNQSSFLHVPSTISSLIVSSLVQNPAAHAAASFAATLMHPPKNAEASSRDHVNPPISMAAIAGATVAAATAWWAAHGLLPVCTPPFYNPSSTSTSTCPFSFGNGNQTRVDDTSNERDKAPSEQHLSSSSSSEEESDGKLNTPEEMVPPVVVVETTTTNVRKQVDRSSCGSNTTSSSEIETNALDKHVKEKEEAKGSDDVNDSSSRGRTSRSSIISPNESWKEVSEEGRLAFQALFSREVLPQSFSDTRRWDIPDSNQLDLNQAAAVGESNGFAHLQQAVGLPSVKLNFNHTGFKPYKRCSIDAKETTKTIAASSSCTGNQNEDHKASKRMRLETST